MQVKTLDHRIHTDQSRGFLCRYIRSDTEYFRPHNHNYYEIFLMLNGEACHLINGEKRALSRGDLIFIRDFDTHDYVRRTAHFEFINLAFTAKHLRAVYAYLLHDFESDPTLTARMPPEIYLSERETRKLYYALGELTSEAATPEKLRLLLAQIFGWHFFAARTLPSDLPSWLFSLCEEMKKPQNFIRGVEYMREHSGKSREHLSRSMRKYLNTTPSEFIAALRLDYSAGLLISSNLSITEICFECGFDNLSWYYKAFEKRFGMTPGRYRKR